MSFGDLYTVQPGQDVAPGLPPVDLPKVEGRQPVRVTVHPKAQSKPWEQDYAKEGDTWRAKPAALPWEKDYNDIEPKRREVSGLEAFGRSAATGASFGLAPAIAGAMKAGEDTDETGGPFSELYNLIRGISRVVGGEGKSSETYRQARDEAQAALEAGREQHPIASFAGELTGAAAMPLPGMAPGTLAARIGRGVLVGGLGGAAYGAGSGVSKGEDLGDIAAEAAKGGIGGAALGGAFGGLLGPRAIRPATSAGERAAQTAADLGAPIPRGLASDNAALNATTAKLRSVPLLGSRISSAVDATQAAAGRRVGEIAAGNLGVAPDRALAGATLRPALQGVVNDNNARIDLAYQALRHVIDPDAVSPVPRTAAALRGIMGERVAARMARPESGLRDIIHLTNRGASFNGLQRARADVGKIIGLAENNPNPGFNVGDFKRLYAAMSGDMEGTVRANARGVHPNRAADVLREANRAADTLIERNKGVQRVLNVRADERLVGSLVTSAQEKSGNLRLLAQLRASMHPDDFHQIAGTLLHELGQNNATGEFSLNKFVTGWDKVSDGAKRILFSPQHLRNVEDIVGLGRHIKGALRESNTSHTAGVLILFDLARDAILLGASAAAGTMTGATMVGGAIATPGVVLAHWLSRPATASSMAAWNRARIGIFGHPTPARLAAFNLATRNLANNVQLPWQRILQITQQRVAPGRAEDTEQIPGRTEERPSQGRPGQKDQSRLH